MDLEVRLNYDDWIDEIVFVELVIENICKFDLMMVSVNLKMCFDLVFLFRWRLFLGMLIVIFLRVGCINVFVFGIL